MVERTIGKECSLAYDSLAPITMQQIPNGISSLIISSAPTVEPDQTQIGVRQESPWHVLLLN
jgi:hypothetical protein